MTIVSTPRKPDLPRWQTGPNPQHLLVTLLGDFWRNSNEPLSSSGLVALLSEFGISEASARSALSRLAGRGVLVASKSGRQTFYRLSDETRAVGIRTIPRLLAFGDPNSLTEPWDGTWVVVAFSVPDEQRQLRSGLRAKLRWFGFTPLQDGVWMAARSMDEELSAMLAELDEKYVTAFESRLVFPETMQARSQISGMHLDELRADYERFIDEYGPLRESALAGGVSSGTALVTRVQLMDRWRGFYRTDPKFPDQLLPDAWPREIAAEIFLTTYDALGPLAELRCRQIMENFGATEAQRPHHFTSKSINDEP